MYVFNCPLSHSKATTYIGYTECTLDRRITAHLYKGSIKQHFITDHNIKPTKQQIVDNTSILAKANNKQKLTIKEALLILKYSPSINRQFDNFQHTLKLHKHHTTSELNIPNSDQQAQNPTADDSQISSQSNLISLASPTLRSPLVSQISFTPSAPNLSQTPSTFNTLHITNSSTISPNIQYRIDSLFQTTQVDNQPNNVSTSPTIMHSHHSHSIPYNLRPR